MEMMAATFVFGRAFSDQEIDEEARQIRGRSAVHGYRRFRNKRRGKAEAGVAKKSEGKC